MNIPSMCEGLFGEIDEVRIPTAAEVNKIREESDALYNQQLREKYIEEILWAAQAGFNYCFTSLQMTPEIKDELIKGGYTLTQHRTKDGLIELCIRW